MGNGVSKPHLSPAATPPPPSPQPLSSLEICNAAGEWTSPAPPLVIPHTSNPRQRRLDESLSLGEHSAAYFSSRPETPGQVPLTSSNGNCSTAVEVRSSASAERQSIGHLEADRNSATATPLAMDVSPPSALQDTVVREVQAKERPTRNAWAGGDEADESNVDVAWNVPSPSVELASTNPLARGDSSPSSPSPHIPEDRMIEEGPARILVMANAADQSAEPESLPHTTTASPVLPSSAAEGQVLAARRQLAVEATPYRSLIRSASPALALNQYDALPLSSLRSVLREGHRVYRICLTGGPCAGKSTMLSQIQAKIPQRTGHRVMCVPEAATLLVSGGMQWDASLVVQQQRALLRLQLFLEDQFYALAVASGHPTIIISDRGTMDGRAFCSEEQFQEILDGVGSTLDVLRDRYDAVLHMVTAACGAEAYYNLDNPSRYEDLDGARASDKKLQEMYVGHPMFRLLDNSTTFEEKVEKGLHVVAQVVQQELSVPAAAGYYLVRHCPAVLPVASATYQVMTTILGNSAMNDIRMVVRRIMADGSELFFFKTVRQGSATAVPPLPSSRGTSYDGCDGRIGSTPSFAAAPSQRIENVQRISRREYASLRLHRDASREEVAMATTHFIYDGSNYELTTLLSPSWAAGRQTVTVESCMGGAAASMTDGLRLPPFLEVDREVPVTHLTTAFLISHRETGPLYTSLAFAPVFSRAVVSAIGAHADVEDILRSTHSTPRHPSVLRLEAADGRVMADSHRVVQPVVAEEKKEEEVAEAVRETTRGGTPADRALASELHVEERLTPLPLQSPTPTPRLALGAMDVNQSAALAAKKLRRKVKQKVQTSRDTIDPSSHTNDTPAPLDAALLLKLQSRHPNADALLQSDATVLPPIVGRES